MNDFLETIANQTKFADLVGCSAQAIQKQAMKIGLKKGDTYRQWLRIYVEHLRAEAAGRMGETGESISRQKIKESEQKTLQLMLSNLKEVGLLVSVDDARDLLTRVGDEIKNIDQCTIKVVELINSTYKIEVDNELVFEPFRSAVTSAAHAVEKLGQSFGGDGAWDQTETGDVDGPMG